jgi:outer membrane lipoprotein-sorting protein
MSLYHLYARVDEGSLRDPSRSELRIEDADDLGEMVKLAKTLVSDGFTVWIYDHGNTTMCAGGSDYRTVLRYDPDGTLVDYR